MVQVFYSEMIPLFSDSDKPEKGEFSYIANVGKREDGSFTYCLYSAELGVKGKYVSIETLLFLFGEEGIIAVVKEMLPYWMAKRGLRCHDSKK